MKIMRCKLVACFNATIFITVLKYDVRDNNGFRRTLEIEISTVKREIIKGLLLHGCTMQCVILIKCNDVRPNVVF